MPGNISSFDFFLLPISLPLFALLQDSWGEGPGGRSSSGTKLEPRHLQADAHQPGASKLFLGTKPQGTSRQTGRQASRPAGLYLRGLQPLNRHETQCAHMSKAKKSCYLLTETQHPGPPWNCAENKHPPNTHYLFTQYSHHLYPCYPNTPSPLP